MNFLFTYIDLINFYIENFFVFSLIFFLIFLILYNSLSLPGTSIFLISSGFFFDLLIGFFINLFSIVIGSFIFYLSSNFFFKSFFAKIYNKYSRRITNIIIKSSYEYLILLRLIPIAPLFFQNLSISLMNISSIKFILTTFIGFIPMMFIFAYIGSSISDILELRDYNSKDLFSSNFIIFLSILIFLIIMRIILKKYNFNINFFKKLK